MKYIHLKLLFFIYLIFGQAPDLFFTRTFGGLGNDKGFEVFTINDNGAVIAGRGDPNNKCLDRAYIVKIDLNLNEEWSQTYGDGDEDSRHTELKIKSLDEISEKEYLEFLNLKNVCQSYKKNIFISRWI
mgnify:CR=1 FL=1